METAWVPACAALHQSTHFPLSGPLLLQSFILSDSSLAPQGKKIKMSQWLIGGNTQEPLKTGEWRETEFFVFLFHDSNYLLMSHKTAKKKCIDWTWHLKGFTVLFPQRSMRSRMSLTGRIWHRATIGDLQLDHFQAWHIKVSIIYCMNTFESDAEIVTNILKRLEGKCFINHNILMKVNPLREASWNHTNQNGLR